MISQGLPMAAVGVDVGLHSHPLCPQRCLQQEGVFHWDAGVVSGVPKEEGRSLPRDLLLQGDTVQQFLVLLAQQVFHGTPVRGWSAGDHTVAQHYAVRTKQIGAAAQGTIELLLVPQQPCAARQMPSGGEAHDHHRVGIDMIAGAVVPYVGHCRQQLPLGDGPPGLGRDMVA